MPVKEYRRFFLISGFVLLILLGGILAILPHQAMAYPIDASSSDNFTQAQNVPYQTMNPQVFLPSIRHDGQQYTWSLLGPDGFNVATMASQSSILFAGTYGGGALRSVDNGQTWEQMTGGLPDNVSVQQVATADQVPALYAAVRDGYKIYRSEDSGNTWSPVTPPSVLWVSALAMNPITPTTVYAGTAIFETFGGEVFRSQDGGESWEQILPQYTDARDIAIDPKHTNILYLGRASQGGMLKSYDAGDSWAPVNNGLSGNALSIVDILIDPDDPLNVYIGTADGLFHSLDGGGSWSEIGQALPGQFIYSIEVMPDVSGELVASTSAGGTCHGISKSINGGVAWQDISGNLGSNTCVKQLLSTEAPHSFLYAVAEIEYSFGQIWQLQNP